MSDYSNAIESDLRWRELELAALKVIAIGASENEIAYQTMLRALVAMLYAHYEGFTKFCWHTYLDELQQRHVPAQLLDDALRLLALEDLFRRVRGDLTPTSLWGLHSRDIPERLAEPATFSEKCRPATDSNLWPAVFRRETGRLGIECLVLDEHEVRLKSLVARRNDIAHGQKLIIRSIEDYEPFEKAVVLILHELALSIIEKLDQDAFLRA